MIKKIHQIWVQGLDEFKKTKFYPYSLDWTRLFPNWEYKLWSEQEYMPLIHRYSSRLVDLYNNSPSYAFKSDIARYVILWNYGGLYVDTDYEPFVNFEYLLQRQNTNLAVVYIDYPTKEWLPIKFNNAWIYSVEKCDYLKLIIDSIDGQKTETSMEYGIKNLRNFSDAILNNMKDDVLVLPYNMIELLGANNLHLVDEPKNELLKLKPYAVGIHRFESSWVENKDLQRDMINAYNKVTQYSDFV
jgi:hypothetical protein